MDSKLIGHVLFPLHEWVKGKPTFLWLRRLEKSCGCRRPSSASCSGSR